MFLSSRIDAPEVGCRRSLQRNRTLETPFRSPATSRFLRLPVTGSMFPDYLFGSVPQSRESARLTATVLALPVRVGPGPHCEPVSRDARRLSPRHPKPCSTPPLPFGIFAPPDQSARCSPWFRSSPCSTARSSFAPRNRLAISDHRS
jgi:hypothetical protein